jgi:hypothetical protein
MSGYFPFFLLSSFWRLSSELEPFPWQLNAFPASRVEIFLQLWQHCLPVRKGRGKEKCPLL